MDTHKELRRSPTRGDGESQAARGSGGIEPALRPNVDIFETSDDITLHADMPGVSRERLEIRVEGTSLFIEGRIDIDPQEQLAPVYADVRTRTYRRSFVLGNELEADKIQANLKDGLLTLRIPKRAEVRPRRIEVKT